MKLTIPDQKYELIELYDRIATEMGFYSETCRYDCRKVEIAKNLQDNIYQYYIEQNPDKPKCEIEFSVTMLLAVSGPKVNKQLSDNQVEIYDGFIVRED